MNAVLWFLAVVGVSWFVILFVIPFLGKLFLRRLSKKFQNYADNSHTEDEQPEGSVHIKNIPPDTEKKPDLGDYVNYEEIIEK